jgi:hypothetical protein
LRHKGQFIAFVDRANDLAHRHLPCWSMSAATDGRAGAHFVLHPCRVDRPTTQSWLRGGAWRRGMVWRGGELTSTHWAG